MMLVGASVAIRAVSLHIRLAGRSLCIQAKAIFASKKVAEIEGVCWLPSFRAFLLCHLHCHRSQYLGHAVFDQEV